MAPTVYVVDSDPEERKWIESVLAPAATSVVFLDDGAALLAHMPLPGEACLIAFADRDRAAALELVRALRGGGTKLPVIVLGPLSAFRTAIDIARLEATDFLERPVSARERQRAVRAAAQLIMMAQGYQESQLDQEVKSRSGAIGVMQLMPATGELMQVGDITKIEPNVHAGVKYMRTLIDQYFPNEPEDSLNKSLFALAAYNAGPSRIHQLRPEAAQRGLDPNVWFNHVERLVAEKHGAETVTYASNIYKYYVAYSLVAEDEEERRKTREGFKK